MGFKFKRLKKSLKKATRAVAKVVSHAAPIVGGVLLGPLGAAAGTAVGAAAAQVGPNKNRGAQLQRSLISGLAVTAGTAALGLASGAGIGAPLYKSAGNIFGLNDTPTETTSGNSSWDEYLAQQNASGTPAADPVSAAVATAQNAAAAVSGGGGNAAGLKQQYLDQLALAEKLRAQGDTVGAAQAAALAETYRILLEQSGQTVPTAGGGIDPLWIVGGLALLALTSRGKAA